MTDLTALKALLAKVEAGETTNRQLDAEIDALLRHGSEELRRDCGWALANFPTWRARGQKPGTCEVVHRDGTGGVWWESPHFTTSTDAALALKDAVLPGWYWIVGSGGAAVVNPIEAEESHHSEGIYTPARALLIAILKAKIAEGDVTQETKG